MVFSCKNRLHDENDCKRTMILEEGILITFHHAKRRQTIGDVQVKKGDTVLHQIANEDPGSGNAKVILHNFLSGVLEMYFYQ